MHSSLTCWNRLSVISCPNRTTIRSPSLGSGSVRSATVSPERKPSLLSEPPLSGAVLPRSGLELRPSLRARGSSPCARPRTSCLLALRGHPVQDGARAQWLQAGGPWPRRHPARVPRPHHRSHSVDRPIDRDPLLGVASCIVACARLGPQCGLELDLREHGLERVVLAVEVAHHEVASCLVLVDPRGPRHRRYVCLCSPPLAHSAARRVPTIAPTTIPTISASPVVGPISICSCSGLLLTG